MKKNGFSLIELLAIIVLIGILSLLGYSTIMPYIKNSKEKTFALEANEVVDAAKSAMTLITNKELDDKKYALTRTYKEGKLLLSEKYYCFSLEDLVDLNFWTKNKEAVTGDNKTYDGWVRVRKNTEGSYYYTISMKNSSDYFVSNIQNKVQKEDVQKGEIELSSCNLSKETILDPINPIPGGGGLGGR